MVVAHREHLRWLLPPHCRIRAAGQDSAPIQAATVRHGVAPAQDGESLCQRGPLCFDPGPGVWAAHGEPVKPMPLGIRTRPSTRRLGGLAA